MSASAGRGSTALWVALCGAGLAGGLFAGVALSAPIQAVVGMILVTPVMLALAGSVLGAGQSLALGGGARARLRWIGATAVGMAIGMSLGVVLVEALGRAFTGEQVRLASIGLVGRVLGLTLIGAATGAALGLAQALLMRAGAEARRRWTTASAIGYGLGLPLAGGAVGALPGGLGNPVAFVAFLGLAGLVAGALTAREHASVF